MSTFKIITGLFVTFLVVSVAYGGPAQSPVQSKESELNEKLNLLQQQITDIQNAIGGGAYQDSQPQLPQQQQQLSQLLVPQGNSNNLRPSRYAAWQPMKRMVAWQPMKRSDSIVSTELQRDQLLRAIEAQLSDVLHAGETLGISAEDVLAHLRQRNDNNNQYLFQ